MATIAQMVAALDGDPIEEENPTKRFDALIGKGAPGAAWAPTDLGESVAYNLMAVMVRTAREDDATRVYRAMEDSDALDRLMADVRKSVIREVKAATR